MALDELSYLTMTHFGFDQRFHTGEMIVNAAVAEQVVEIFERLHEARFPIEQMRVITKEEIDAHPTGDWNDTTSFVCRPAVGSTSWSQHAYGTGIDINPFHNPYLKGDLVLPELASAYVDREDVRAGMIVPGDVATESFAEIDWGWGGNWSSLKDSMHFSLSGSRSSVEAEGLRLRHHPGHSACLESEKSGTGVGLVLEVDTHGRVSVRLAQCRRRTGITICRTGCISGVLCSQDRFGQHRVVGCRRAGKDHHPSVGPMFDDSRSGGKSGRAVVEG